MEFEIEKEKDKMKKKGKCHLWMGFFLGIFVCLLGGFVYSALGSFGILPWEREQTGAHALETQRKLKSIERKISKYYLEEADGQKMVDGLYRGYVSALGDPYSTYYNEKEYKAMNEEASGQYKGIGIVMQQDSKTGFVRVVRCYENTPSARAGILVNDIILKVNQKDVQGKDLSQIAMEIKKEGTKEVNLTIKREGKSKEIEFTLIPEAIEVPVVASKLLDSQIAYIQIAEFTEVTKSQFDNQWKKLKKEGATRLIIDLRNNPGGLLSSVVDLVDEFLSDGDMIVYTEDKYKKRVELKAGKGKEIEVPLVVLVNENSASASEIFAGAVKDHKLGTLVGSKTFGKGIVQQIFTLQDKSALKITVSKYFTPNGNDIHKVGIVPDVEIKEEKQEKEKEVEEKDKALEKAIEILEKK